MTVNEVIYNAKTRQQEIITREVTNQEIKGQENFNTFLRISELKELLSASDYKTLKFAEGELSAEEYEPIKQQRRAWREEINLLEKQLG